MAKVTTSSEQPDEAGFPAHDVIGFILDHEREFSRSHRKIARAILEHPTTFVEKPIEDLVTWLEVSAPTITRFSRMTGCDGLRDLKLKIMSGMRVGTRYFEPGTPPGSLKEVGERIVMRAQRAIMEAQRTVDFAMLERAIDLVSHSRMIYAFGGGGVSSWLVDEIHNRLFRLGLRISTSSDHQMQMMLAATVERGDVVICSSLSGNNQELIKAARIAADYGASTIALTVAGTPLVRACHVPLAPAVVDDGDVLGPTCLRYAFLSIIDLVAYGTAVRCRPLAQEKLRRIKQQFTTYRDVDDSQPVSD
ncbi:MurR/RpiR family transcriptional regulator [Labrys monachus]|uniref:DNA-binding MurR/RpiR family transcriptional regulator n=1 Tax=Labrys monachus TaxID=217067 RepID=A0ABU0FE79_9HYPH|nr:MurR/RpiR family transcriptional regulator [Labrys monachus]MDQ0392919.1 DNA-binding MurR/RpiR family transcriptional regulator [Labrys monachus]